ncbi:hypothetical protein ACH5RR_009996 [Cinchona calisaya]|uniref:Uncharacterized protein n=1 Tax=Cinchona calisaya TaxID=153742 RepID=A0ABD3AHC0_9GENT
MGFFDLNLPYHESDRRITGTTTTTLKSDRLKLVIKAAELGYTGVAYNRIIKGVMSESDRCSTPLFPLSSLLKLSPSLSSSVKFHRDLLNVPVSTPFRQYTRLTVVIDSPAQAAALNSGNPVLKTYDIVAVRPMNQNAFEQACQASEVDIISIDFWEKLPFRLKQSMIKAAIKRGVYFEISYSSFIIDAQVRRQMISNAKLLVDWTRGKNLVVSSAAPSVSELRGPYDVANLLFLVGMPLEHAKAAVSKNCRSVIASALRKKHCYKEAIKIEIMPSNGKVNSEESVYSDWLKWDPISSGEGDLLLDDIEKSFSASGSVSNTVNTVRFVSALNSLPSHGLQIKETLSAMKFVPETLSCGKILSSADETKVAVSVYGISDEPCGPNILLGEGQTSEETRNEAPSHQDSEISSFPNNNMIDSTLAEEKINQVVGIADLRNSKQLDAGLPTADREFDNLFLQSCLDSSDGQVIRPIDVTSHISTNDADTAHTCHDITCAEVSVHSKDTVFSFRGEESKLPIKSCMGFYADSVSVEEDKIWTAPENKSEPLFVVSDASFNEGFSESKQFQERSENLITLADEFSIEGFLNPMEEESGFLVSETELMQEDMMEEQREIEDEVAVQCQILGESTSGRARVKRRKVHRHFPFPLKRILNSRPFKKKTHK